MGTRSISARPIRSRQDALASMQRGTYGFKAGQLNPANNPLNLLPGMTFSGVTDPPNLTWNGRFPLRSDAVPDRRGRQIQPYCSAPTR